MERFAVSTLISFIDQQTEWECRIRMIDEAKHFLYGSTYFIQHDRYGRQYINALLAARSRGVCVILLIDAFGQMISGNLMTKGEKENLAHAMNVLVQSGAIVSFYRCPNLLQRMLGSGMHIKIQLSEKGGALFASGNISATSYDRWREFSVYVEGAIVTRLLKEFEAYAVAVDPAHHEQLRANVSKESTRSVNFISYDPTHDPHPLNPILLSYPNHITTLLAEAFAQARSRISLTSLYFKPSPILVKALADAARRGVVVEIFHSHRDALGPSILPWVPSVFACETLINAGATVYENQKGEHSKVILIDGGTVIFGSYNLEYAAHDRLAEAMMISTDPQMLATADALFHELRTCPDNAVVSAPLAAAPWNIRCLAQCLKPIARWL